MIEKKRCNAASQKPLKSTFTLLFCVGDIKPSCFYSANHWWIVHVNYWFFFLKSTTLNLRQMDSTGRHYLSMNDRLFCMCVFQDLFQVGEIIEAPSHAKLEVVQSWTLSPLTSQRPQFNHFPSRRCVQVVLGNARLSLPPVFPPDVSWMKSHLIQMKFFWRRKVAAFMCLMDFLRIMWEDERGAEPFAVNRWRLRFKKNKALVPASTSPLLMHIQSFTLKLRRTKEASF